MVPSPHENTLQWILSSELQPRRQKHDRIVQQNKPAENTNISPDVLVVDTESLAELIAIGILAELADAVGGGLHVPTSLLYVRTEILLA